MEVKLVMFKANGQRRDFVLSKTTIIGRSNDCQIQIPLGTVSRKHAELTIDGPSLHVRDLGSSNGTFVNDQRIQDATLEPGDKITVGPVIFIASIDGEPEDIKPVRTVIVEHAVEPISHSEGGDGTIDAEAEEEELPLDPLAALQAMTKPKR